MEVTMDKHLFDELLESVTQMDEIQRGERSPSREFHVDAVQVKKIRQATGLSQAIFAKTIDVPVGTLRNWEQGRRDPEGPAKALLRAINNDPTHVLAALRPEPAE
jgi:putative transcriptional regulator